MKSFEVSRWSPPRWLSAQGRRVSGESGDGGFKMGSIASGNGWHSYGKLPFLMGKSTISTGPFSIAICMFTGGYGFNSQKMGSIWVDLRQERRYWKDVRIYWIWATKCGEITQQYTIATPYRVTVKSNKLFLSQSNTGTSCLNQYNTNRKHGTVDFSATYAGYRHFSDLGDHNWFYV